jgi:ABC-2 type transport system permease protein
MRKFLAYFRQSLADAFIYRATGFIWMLNDLGPALIMLLFWLAAFKNRPSVSGYTPGAMIVYYLGVMLINNLVSFQPQYFLSDEIRTGQFSNYLVKPINLTAYKLAGVLCWRLVRLIFFLPAMLVITKLFSRQLQSLDFSQLNFSLFLAGLVLAFLLNFFIKLVLGLLTFWFLEAGWIFFIFEVLASFFSGEALPLDLFPPSLNLINNLLPFKYLLYFPLSLLLGRAGNSRELLLGFAMAVFWTVVSYGLYRRVLHKGIRNYCAYGG